MSALPLIVVVGGDALAARVCEELCATEGHRVALLWPHDPELAARVAHTRTEYLAFPPNSSETLHAVGIAHATSIMTLSEDDRLNLQVALKARDINPHVRVVLRQFNRTLGRKIEQNLPDCTVVSLSHHAAATFTGAVLDGACFYGLEFPDFGGPIVGFSERSASAYSVAGMTVAAAEAMLDVRIVGRNGGGAPEPHERLEPNDHLVLFGKVTSLARALPKRKHVFRRRWWRALSPFYWYGRAMAEVKGDDRMIRFVAIATFAIFALMTLYFDTVYHKGLMTAAYFVVITMTTLGYGDITPLEKGPLPQIMAMLLAVVGLVLSGIFVGLVSSVLTRAQVKALQGVRQIRLRDHVIVCGTGQVGVRVTESLRSLNRRVVVVEKNPDTIVVEQTRNGEFDLLTGDATREDILDLCNIRFAHAVVATTDSDTANLEIALGARARNPSIPVVMRVQDDTFARLIARQFGLHSTFSTASLAASTFAGLSRFPGTRGRIRFGDEDYNVGERIQGEVVVPPPARDCIPLCVERGGQIVLVDAFEKMRPHERYLFLVPLSQFRTSAPVSEPAVEETRVSG